MAKNANKRRKCTAATVKAADGDDATPQADAPETETEGGSSNKNGSPCPNLRHCIERWKLMPPYVDPDNDSHWGDYYLERATLEFRSGHFFDDGGGEVETLTSRKYCSQWDKGCKDAVCTEEDTTWCPNCVSKLSDKHRSVEPTPELKEKWGKYVNEDECLRDIIVTDDGDKSAKAFSQTMPRLRPYCASPTYAKYNHPSGTVKGEYEDLIGTMRDRVSRTMLSCPTLKDREALADVAAAGLYIQSYRIEYDEDGTDETPHTVEIGTRFYSPVGSGSSLDLVYYYHVDNNRDEKYSILYAWQGGLEEAAKGRRNGWSPTDVTDWRKEGEFNHGVLAMLDGDSQRERNARYARKTFCTLSKIWELRNALL